MARIEFTDKGEQFGTGKPGLSLSRRGLLYINRCAREGLGNAEYVTFGYDPETREFFIGAAQAGQGGAYKVTVVSKSGGSVSIPRPLRHFGLKAGAVRGQYPVSVVAGSERREVVAVFPDHEEQARRLAEFVAEKAVEREVREWARAIR